MPKEKMFPRNILNRNSPKPPSAIDRIAFLARELGLVIKPQPPHISCKPAWMLKNYCIIKSLWHLPKRSTSPDTYLSLFYETINTFNDWSLAYTDGSKTSSGTGYAVVNADFNIIRLARLNHYSSVFTAESEAIAFALKAYSSSPGKHIICTDSLSSIKAIENVHNRSSTITIIRDLLITHENKLKLMWIPSHVGIRGNHAADEAAKFATSAPVILQQAYNKSDLSKEIHHFFSNQRKHNWSNFSHYYKQINPSGNAPTYPADIERIHIQKYIRLRLGHTLLTHQHLMENTDPPHCPICRNQTITITHLIENCIKSNRYHNCNLKNLLKDVNYNNISIAISILKENKLYFHI